MDRNHERKLLQLAVAIACLVPLAAGGSGILQGTSMAGGGAAPVPADLDSHFRYLSGLLLGVGAAFALSIPTVERRSELFAILTAIVVIGGASRLAALITGATPSGPHVMALGMELVVVPLLFAWQRRIAGRFRS